MKRLRSAGDRAVKTTVKQTLMRGFTVQSMQYKTERYGVLFQGAYKWDQTGRPTPTWMH